MSGFAEVLTYKFLPPGRLSYLDDSLLRFTQPDELNDPFECTAIVSDEIAEAVMRKIIKDAQPKFESLRPTTQEKKNYRQFKRDMRSNKQAYIKSARETFHREMKARLNSDIGVLSLSRRCDSSLMWSHYGQSHTGFCVGFDCSHEFFKAKSHRGILPLRDVAYSKERTQVPSEDGFDRDFSVLFTKSMDWKYEEEQRVLGWLKRSDLTRDRRPYPVHLFEVPHDSIHEIIVGARASEQVIAKVRMFCSKNRIRMFRSEPSRLTFDMERSVLK